MFNWLHENEAIWLFVVLTSELGVSIITCLLTWRCLQEKTRMKIKRQVTRFLKSLGIRSVR